jgi:altronate dehydratase
VNPRERKVACGAMTLRIDPRDNVATALSDLPEGSKIEVEVGGAPETIRLRAAVPLGHKVALLDIPAGGPVIKYGEPIGLARSAIARGDHVHVHNVDSRPPGGGT